MSAARRVWSSATVLRATGCAWCMVAGGWSMRTGGQTGACAATRPHVPRRARPPSYCMLTDSTYDEEPMSSCCLCAEKCRNADEIRTGIYIYTTTVAKPQEQMSRPAETTPRLLTFGDEPCHVDIRG